MYVEHAAAADPPPLEQNQLSVVNVLGDGHSFYRCLYRIVADDDVLRILFLLGKRETINRKSKGYSEWRKQDEERSVWCLRTSVASAFAAARNLNHHEEGLTVSEKSEELEDRNSMRKLVSELLDLKLVQNVDGLDDLYPYLSLVHSLNTDEALGKMYTIVRSTTTRATGIDIGVALRRLSKFGIKLMLISLLPRRQQHGTPSLLLLLSHEIARVLSVSRTENDDNKTMKRGTEQQHNIAILVKFGVSNSRFSIVRFRGAYVYPVKDIARYLCEQGLLRHDDDCSRHGSDQFVLNSNARIF